MQASAGSRFVKREDEELTVLRRLLLELWAMFVLAAIVGFMGPFGTYMQSGLADRIQTWWMLLMGAYVLVRPAILLLRKLASITDLPGEALVFWGVWLCSAPLAAIWRGVGQDAFRQLHGYTGLVPFSLLCSIAVMAVARWAAAADLRLAHRSAAGEHEDIPAVEEAPAAQDRSVNEDLADTEPSVVRQPSLPTLANRLTPAFHGPILALQSEDHYVRVHGSRDSELVLMRLRDAIAEMNSVPGEQVHRSWWVARRGIASVNNSGRNWAIELTSGQTVPVARDTISRLRRAGFFPSLADEVESVGSGKIAS